MIIADIAAPKKYPILTLYNSAVLRHIGSVYVNRTQIFPRRTGVVRHRFSCHGTLAATPLPFTLEMLLKQKLISFREYSLFIE